MDEKCAIRKHSLHVIVNKTLIIVGYGKYLILFKEKDGDDVKIRAFLQFCKR